MCAACAERLAPPPEAGELRGLDAAVALFAYDGAGRQVVGALKFRNHRDAVASLAPMLAGAADAAAAPATIDVVTWIPTTAARRRARGYDQARLLATAVARTLGVPVRALLRRADDGVQTGRDRAARSAVAFHPRRTAAGASVLVVDDVRTTGASLSAAAVALRSAGATTVLGATLAATPARSSGRRVIGDPFLYSADDRHHGPPRRSP